MGGHGKPRFTTDIFREVTATAAERFQSQFTMVFSIVQITFPVSTHFQGLKGYQIGHHDLLHTKIPNYPIFLEHESSMQLL